VAEKALRQQEDAYHQGNKGGYIHPAKSGSSLAVHRTENGAVESIFSQWAGGCRFLHGW